MYLNPWGLWRKLENKTRWIYCMTNAKSYASVFTRTKTCYFTITKRLLLWAASTIAENGTVRGSIFSTATRLELDDRWVVVRILEGTRDSSLLQSDQTGSTAHPPSQSKSAGWSFPGVKQPKREAGYSTAPNAGVKNKRMYISIPMCLHGVYRNNTNLLFSNRHP